MIADAWNDPEYEDKEGARLGRRRSMLGVPLLREGEVIGAIVLARRVSSHSPIGRSNSSAPSPIRR